MRTRQRHLVDESTSSAVHNTKNGSWATTAESLGFPASMGATLSAVALRKPSAVTAEGENAIRRALRLPPIRRDHPCRKRPKYLRPCLSPDPHRRLVQLAELTVRTQREIEEAGKVNAPV